MSNKLTPQGRNRRRFVLGNRPVRASRAKRKRIAEAVNLPTDRKKRQALCTEVAANHPITVIPEGKRTT